MLRPWLDAHCSIPSLHLSWHARSLQTMPRMLLAGKSPLSDLSLKVGVGARMQRAFHCLHYLAILGRSQDACWVRPKAAAAASSAVACSRQCRTGQWPELLNLALPVWPELQAQLLLRMFSRSGVIWSACLPAETYCMSNGLLLAC